MPSEELPPLFAPDPRFAPGWSVDDALAQGALRHGCSIALDRLSDAIAELWEDSPDLGDFGALGDFPRALRTVLTPKVVRKIHLAAVVIGWKLAQPGPPIPPANVAEELALELIREQAVDALALIEAEQKSVDALNGIYQYCVHGNLKRYFAAITNETAALGTRYRLPGDDPDRVVAQWFRPFVSGQIGSAPHPEVNEEIQVCPADTDAGLKLVTAGSSRREGRVLNESFRVVLRTWPQDLLEQPDYDRFPTQWWFRSSAATAKDAAIDVLNRNDVVNPAVVATLSPYPENIDDTAVVRLSLDVQRHGIDQALKGGLPHYVLGRLAPSVEYDQLPALAADLSRRFPAALVAVDRHSPLFAVALAAESYEEAEADVMDAIADVSDELSDYVGEQTIGSGSRSIEKLQRMLQVFARDSRRDTRPASDSAA